MIIEEKNNVDFLELTATDVFKIDDEYFMKIEDIKDLDEDIINAVSLETGIGHSIKLSTKVTPYKYAKLVV